MVDIKRHVLYVLTPFIIDRRQRNHTILSLCMKCIAVLIHNVAVRHVLGQTILRGREICRNRRQVCKEDVATANLVKYFRSDVSLAYTSSGVLIYDKFYSFFGKLPDGLSQCRGYNIFDVPPVILP